MKEGGGGLFLTRKCDDIFTPKNFGLEAIICYNNKGNEEGHPR